jgi:sterol desaturase/sphingolipid hydroxylase (fatty acid hydroxylase superfamily)
MQSITRRFLTKIALIVLPVSVLLFVAIYSSKNSNYIDFSLNFIARKYEGAWTLMLLDIIGYIAILVSIAIYKGWDGSALRRLVINPSGTSAHDLVMWLLRITYVSEVLVYLVTFGIAKRLKWHLKDFFEFDTQWILSMDNIIVQQILFLLIVDLVYYWMHRIEHKTPFLWAYHKFHHSATEMNVITSKRIHPVESEIIKAVFFAFPFALLGVPFYSFLVMRIIMKFHGAIVHSGLEWSWGWLGKYILLSPKYHALHHSQAPEHHHNNFANHFPIFDHLFGTYCDEEIENITYGVADDNHNNTNLLNALWIGVTESFNALTDLISGQNSRELVIKDNPTISDNSKTP